MQCKRNCISRVHVKCNPMKTEQQHTEPNNKEMNRGQICACKAHKHLTILFHQMREMFTIPIFVGILYIQRDAIVIHLFMLLHGTPVSGVCMSACVWFLFQVIEKWSSVRLSSDSKTKTKIENHITTNPNLNLNGLNAGKSTTVLGPEVYKYLVRHLEHFVIGRGA